VANAKITSKGQITIPRDVRERLGLRPGDDIEFVEESEGYRIQKLVPVTPFKKYRGYLKHLAGQDPDQLVESARGGRGRYQRPARRAHPRRAPHGQESERALAETIGAAALLMSEPVYAELAVQFSDRMDWTASSGTLPSGWCRRAVKCCTRLAEAGANTCGDGWRPGRVRSLAPCRRCSAISAARASSPDSTW
jgi:antitoxin PrlF